MSKLIRHDDDCEARVTPTLFIGSCRCEVRALQLRVIQLEAALYPIVLEIMRADMVQDAPEFVSGEGYEAAEALPKCKPCAGTGATDHKHYEDQPIPDAVRCDRCHGWGFTMHAHVEGDA